MDRDRKRQMHALLEAQHSLIARWQLEDIGCSEGEINWQVADWRTVHAAVYICGHGPLTTHQRHLAATLTEPATSLARWSTLALHGLRDEVADHPIHVVREGSRGHRVYPRREGRLDALDLRYSLVLEGDIEEVDGVSSTVLPRAILDLCIRTSRQQRDRMFRDAIRLRRTTRDEFDAMARKHRGHRGVGRLRELLSYYEEIPVERTRSDAEVEGLVVLRDAGMKLPEVNVEVAGFECDFVDFERRVILELDGKSTHQFPARDAERNAAWEAAGFTVQRRPTDDAYDRPHNIVTGMRGEAAPIASPR